MMNNLEALKRMAVFASVLDTGSFSGAATRLGMAKSAVSRHVSLLEEQLGVRLLARTTRRLALTDGGQEFHRRCVRMLAEADEAFAAIGGHTDTPTGTLRISAPQQLGRAQIAPALAAFHQRFPALTIELSLDDAYVDLVAENIDVAIRVGTLSDSSLVARKLASTDAVICAAPSYLKARGEPKTHAQLAGHSWIVYTLSRTPHRLPLITPKGARVTVSMRGPIRTSSGNADHALALAGAGLAYMPRFYAEEDIAAGRLCAVLPNYRTPTFSIFAVYLPSPVVAARTRAFIDFIAVWFERTCTERPAAKRARGASPPKLS